MGSETYDLTAAEIEGAERERPWAQQLEHTPYFAGFQERAGRRIPVSRSCVRRTVCGQRQIVAADPALLRCGRADAAVRPPGTPRSPRR
ncbi:hypothetical protein ACWD8L_33615 [Streptomyces sp. NPDC005133]|uniref:hypothetical protein n=1 Tax=unclassified Streptomyces TaxID=2593676 RepID=UPI0033AF1AB4